MNGDPGEFSGCPAQSADDLGVLGVAELATALSPSLSSNVVPLLRLARHLGNNVVPALLLGRQQVGDVVVESGGLQQRRDGVAVKARAERGRGGAGEPGTGEFAVVPAG